MRDNQVKATSHPGESLRRRRPGPSGAPDIREQLLDAAEFLFATRGFAATSIREIAERVNVTPAMAHYYYGSKKKLLQAVMERALEPMVEALSALAGRERIGLPDLVAMMSGMLADHPFIPQLITREVFLAGGQLQQEFLREFAPRLGGRLPALLRREQEGHRLSADFDPAVLALLVLSLCIFPFVARPAAEAVLGVHYDEAGLLQLSRQVGMLLQRGTQP